MATHVRRARREGKPTPVWQQLTSCVAGRAIGQFFASIIIWMAGGDC